MIDLKSICLDVCELTRTTGGFIKSEAAKFSTNQVEIKGKNDFVSYVDKTAEKLLVEGLGRLLPEAGYIAEEGTSSKKGEVYNWIIDPLDGTTNFIHGLPCFSISIALMREHVLVLGVVYEINHNECFYAWENGPAYLNEKTISVSKVTALANSLLATGFPYHDYGRMDEYLELFKYFMKHIFDAIGCGDTYYRISPDIGKATIDMDDASPENLKALKDAGMAAAFLYDNQLEKIASFLVESEQKQRA